MFSLSISLPFLVDFDTDDKVIHAFIILQVLLLHSQTNVI